MAYDPELASRLRALLADEPDLTERKMFGGLAFLLGGHMTVAASHTGGLLARVDPATSADLCARGGASPMVMRDRAMPGWLHVDAERVREPDALREWVTRCATYARTLPPK